MSLTPAQERAILQAVEAGIGKELSKATEELKKLIAGGMAARDAVDQVFGKFAKDYGRLYQNAMEKVAGAAAQTGPVNLSINLYNQRNKVSAAVETAVKNHVTGYQDARKLARELYEGYDAEGGELLQIKKTNQKLPKYMREAVLDTGDTGAVKRAFAKLQARGLKTQALNAAYSEVLAALDNLESGAGAELLNKRLEVAFYEKGRFYANRVAQTELHRSYGLTEAANLLADDDVQYVQINRVGNSTHSCICDQITDQDLYGVGKGVYPVRKAPVPPYHPFCRCIMSPRVDLFGKLTTKELENEALIAANLKTDPVYAIKTIGDLNL